MKISRGIVPTAKRVVIYGVEGIGKTTLASQFPDPVFIDTEGSTNHMDVARFETPSSWQMILDEVQYVIDHPDTCRTLVIDTADWAEKIMIEYLCQKKQWDGLEAANYGKGYTYAAEEFGKLLNKLTELMHKGVNVVMTAHTQLRKVELPEEMGSYDHWEIKISKKAAPMLKEWADLTLFLNYKLVLVNVDGKGQTKGKNKAQGGRRVMYANHTPFWDAKNRFNLPDEMPLDYSQIAHLFRSNDAPVQIPAPELAPAPVEPPKKTQTTIPPANTKAENKAPAAAEKQISLEDIEPVGLGNPPDGSDWVANEKCWYRYREEVHEYLKGEKIPFNIVQNGKPISEAEYQASMQRKAQEKTKAVQASPGGYKEPDMRIPKKLRDLMIANKIEESEIMGLVGAKGYFPPDMAIADYPEDFINGWCVGYWEQVKAAIMEIREKQAYEFK